MDVDKDYIADTLIDLLEEHFPKGRCKERGAAIVLVAQTIIKLKSLGHSIDFYIERMDALQEYQKELPEPYRTDICDILANGSTRR